MFHLKSYIKGHIVHMLDRLANSAQSRRIRLCYPVGGFYGLWFRISSMQNTFWTPVAYPLTRWRSWWKYFQFHLKFAWRTVLPLLAWKVTNQMNEKHIHLNKTCTHINIYKYVLYILAHTHNLKAHILTRFCDHSCGIS